MAITPDECLKLTAGEETLIINFEEVIDQILREKYDSDTATVQVTVETSSSRILRKIIENYRAAGWDVSLVTAGSNSTSYKFKKKLSSGGYYDR